MDITRKYFRQWKQESVLAPRAYDYKNPSLNSDEVVMQELANKFDGNNYETYDGSKFEQTALYDGSKVIVTMSRVSDKYPMIREFIIESDDVWINLILNDQILAHMDKGSHVNAIFGNFDRIMKSMYWGSKSNESDSTSEGLNNYDDHLNYISSEDGEDIPVFTYIHKFNNLIFEFEYDPSYAYCSDPFTLRIYEENNKQYTPKKCLGSWSRNSWDELLEFIEPYSKEESKSILEVVDKSFNDPKIQFDLDQYEKADAERREAEEPDEDEDDLDESDQSESTSSNIEMTAASSKQTLHSARNIANKAAVNGLNPDDQTFVAPNGDTIRVQRTQAVEGTNPNLRRVLNELREKHPEMSDELDELENRFSQRFTRRAREIITITTADGHQSRYTEEL